MDEYACLRVFQHPDIVTSVRFHPGTANLFATGCADGRVRMWEVASGKVGAWGWVSEGRRRGRGRRAGNDGERQGSLGDWRMRMWEVASGKVSFMVQGWQGPRQREEEGEGQGAHGDERVWLCEVNSAKVGFRG